MRWLVYLLADKSKLTFLWLVDTADLIYKSVAKIMISSSSEEKVEVIYLLLVIMEDTARTNHQNWATPP